MRRGVEARLGLGSEGAEDRVGEGRRRAFAFCAGDVEDVKRVQVGGLYESESVSERNGYSAAAWERLLTWYPILVKYSTISSIN